jgi:maltooligosyltrehalose trehalohydrolase
MGIEIGARYTDDRGCDFIVWAPQSREDDFAWSDHAWTGLPRERLVIYELHTGVFTPEGTFDAIIPRLPELRALGVTALELMPVAEFPGERNWGYDGVYPLRLMRSAI